MMKKLILFSLFFITVLCNTRQAKAQMYFPPALSAFWDTTSYTRLKWCQPNIDSLDHFLDTTDTKSFLVLYNGKIVLEKYYGTYRQDSVWYWASASKSLLSTLMLILQQQGKVLVDQKVSDFFGNGWTWLPPINEAQVTFRNIMSMTSGINDLQNNDVHCIDPSCFNYKADAGTRWGYITPSVNILTRAIEKINDTTINRTTNQYICNKISMYGFWYDWGYYSSARGMARFGLLALNKGIWNGVKVSSDTAQFNNLIKPSQNLNQSYGYMWWLNGQPSHMQPLDQIVYPGPLYPGAPADLFAALGLNDQILWVIPSKKMVIIRQGKDPLSFNGFYTYQQELWKYINKLECNKVTVGTENLSTQTYCTLSPQPADHSLNVNISGEGSYTLSIYNTIGELVENVRINKGQNAIDVSTLSNGLYLATITNNSGNSIVLNKKVLIQH